MTTAVIFCMQSSPLPGASFEGLQGQRDSAPYSWGTCTWNRVANPHFVGRKSPWMCPGTSSGTSVPLVGRWGNWDPDLSTLWPAVPPNLSGILVHIWRTTKKSTQAFAIREEWVDKGRTTFNISKWLVIEEPYFFILSLTNGEISWEVFGAKNWRVSPRSGKPIEPGGSLPSHLGFLHR